METSTLLVLITLAGMCSAQCEGNHECSEHRKCMFGDRYDDIYQFLINNTECTSCKTSCNCDCNAAGNIRSDIDAGLFCDKSPVCMDPRAHSIMNYPTDNLECEASFKSMQKFFIQLCGYSRGQCCNGACTESYHISQPSMPCEGRSATSANVRWLLGAYLVLSIILAQWGAAMAQQDYEDSLKSSSQ